MGKLGLAATTLLTSLHRSHAEFGDLAQVRYLSLYPKPSPTTNNLAVAVGEKPFSAGQFDGYGVWAKMEECSNWTTWINQHLT